MPANGRAEKSNDLIQSYIYLQHLEGKHASIEIRVQIAMPTLTSILILRIISGHTSCAKHHYFTTYY